MTAVVRLRKVDAVSTRLCGSAQAKDSGSLLATIGRSGRTKDSTPATKFPNSGRHTCNEERRLLTCLLSMDAFIYSCWCHKQNFCVFMNTNVIWVKLQNHFFYARVVRKYQ